MLRLVRKAEACEKKIKAGENAQIEPGAAVKENGEGEPGDGKSKFRGFFRAGEGDEIFPMDLRLGAGRSG